MQQTWCPHGIKTQSISRSQHIIQASSIVVRESRQSSISDTSPSGAVVIWSRVTPLRKSNSNVRAAKVESLVSSRDMFFVQTRYRRISSFGLPVIAKSINDLSSDVWIESMRRVRGCLLMATGQPWVSTSHFNAWRLPPKTAQWTGNLIWSQEESSANKKSKVENVDNSEQKTIT